MFPESYIELRKELVKNHTNYWKKNGWLMFHRPLHFLTTLNEYLGTSVSPNIPVELACQRFLERLRSQSSLVVVPQSISSFLLQKKESVMEMDAILTQTVKLKKASKKEKNFNNKNNRKKEINND
jgi:hypothetical protein